MLAEKRSRTRRTASIAGLGAPTDSATRSRFAEVPYAENDEPQPQVEVAFGFLITN